MKRRTKDDARPRWLHLWGYDDHNPPPASLLKLLSEDPEFMTLTKRRILLERITNEMRRFAGLPTISFNRRGKRSALHPLPRRDKTMHEELNKRTHKENHGSCFVVGCHWCYLREYVYYQNHPDRRPRDYATAGRMQEGLLDQLHRNSLQRYWDETSKNKKSKD